MKRKQTIVAVTWLVLSLMPSLFSVRASKSIAFQSAPKSPTRRALLIGISKYERPRPAGQGIVNEFKNLAGPPNDVKELAALLQTRYGFQVTVLPEAEATREGILAALERFLIKEASAGEERLVYYAGHGSFIRNSKSQQSNQQDETIVPLDYVRPITKKEEIKDIRDKELAQYFNRALDKRVKVTAIFDSCHSGSIARGDHTITARSGPAATFDLADDDATRQAPKPGEEGALILSAALAGQSALEREYAGTIRGDFTWALIEVLRSQAAEALTAAQLFQQVTARLRGRGYYQEPVLDTTAARRQQNLFGSPVNTDVKRPQFVVSKIDTAKQTVTLDRGRAFGLTVGSEMFRQADANAEQKVRLVVTEASEMTSSQARPLRAEDINKIQVGDVFEQDKWVASKESISIWLPPANLSWTELQKAAQEIAQLKQSARVQMVADPVQELVSHRLFYDGSHWQLELPTSERVAIGTSLSAAQVLQKIGGGTAKIQLFVSLPLARELRQQIRLVTDPEKSAVNLAVSESAATYKLLGRLAQDGTSLEYAWVLPTAFKAETEASQGRSRAQPPTTTQPSPLPLRTDWVSFSLPANGVEQAGSRLEDLALRLNKISGWITLQAPLSRGQLERAFPFRLAIRQEDGTPLAGQTLLENQKYTITLELNPAAYRAVDLQERHVYILSIDQNGNSYVLYPAETGIGNKLPTRKAGELELPIPSLVTFRVDGPDKGGVLGSETYILLATKEPLTDPMALQFDGVISERSKRGDESPLEGLLWDIGYSRSPTVQKVSSDWMIQQVFLQSVPGPSKSK